MNKSDLFLPEGYVFNENVPHFDDTPYTDEYQDDVYRIARLVYDLTEGLVRRTVLDYGCGSGFKLIKHFGGIPRTHLIGIEIEPTISWLMEKFHNDQRIDLWDPIAVKASGARSNLTICSDVIEHVDDPIALLSELHELSAGYLVISTPASDCLGNEMGPPRNFHHHMEWTCDGFHSLTDRYFRIISHIRPNPGHCTQIIVACPK